MITFLTLLPLVFAFMVFLLPASRPELPRATVLTGSLVSLFLAIRLLWNYNPDHNLQFVEWYPWIPSLSIDYHVGVDGLNIAMVFLTALFFPVITLASRPVTRSKSYFILLCVQFTGLFGAFTALNFFHWFLYWELSIVPAFFLIKLFGEDGRHDAAISFFLYTVLGSVAMLVGFFALYFSLGTFDFISLAQKAKLGYVTLTLGVYAPWVFLAILIGLWVKVPLVPLHIWQPETYTRAPIPVAMLMTGLMSKLGVYGILRIILPLFHDVLEVWCRPLLAVTLLTILLGAYAAFRQHDLKKMLAYSSLNHVAYCLLGILVVGFGGVPHIRHVMALQGAVLQMFTHAITAAALFYLIGVMESRTGTRMLGRVGGLRTPMPRFATLLSLFAFSSLGLPFLANFISEFLIFAGSFTIAMPFVLLALPALLTTAIYLLNMLQKTLTGPPPGGSNPDITLPEFLVVAPFLALTVWVGVAPGFWLGLSEVAVKHLVPKF